MDINKQINFIANEFAYSKFLNRFVSFFANEIANRKNKTGIDTLVLSKSLEIDTFDLRTVAFNVATIGESFKQFSDSADFSKLAFYNDEEVFLDFLRKTIEAYLLSEIKAINKENKSFAIDVMIAVTYQNTDKEYEAENRAYEYLKTRYNIEEK